MTQNPTNSKTQTAQKKPKPDADKNNGEGYTVLDSIRCGGQYYVAGDTLPKDAVSEKAAATMRKNKLIK